MNKNVIEIKKVDKINEDNKIERLLAPKIIGMGLSAEASYWPTD